MVIFHSYVAVYQRVGPQSVCIWCPGRQKIQGESEQLALRLKTMTEAGAETEAMK